MADDVGRLVELARTGQPRAVGRLISIVERGDERSAEVARALLPHTHRAQIIGITGSPGVGKSTTTAALISTYRSAGQRVGVLAVDPSSPYSGGALLGDRIRMAAHATDEGVFIRSMATRGQLGGLAAAVPQALRVLDIAGCEVVLVETVGVGQSELEIAQLADTTILLLAPGMGDAVQAAKAGVIEIADVLVVNKADRDGAERTARDLRQMQGMTAGLGDGWTVPVVRTVASRREGIDDLRDAVAGHLAWLRASGVQDRRRRERLAAQIDAIALGWVRRDLDAAHGDPAVVAAVEAAASGRLDVFAAAAAVRRALPGRAGA